MTDGAIPERGLVAFDPTDVRFGWLDNRRAHLRALHVPSGLSLAVGLSDVQSEMLDYAMQRAVHDLLPAVVAELTARVRAALVAEVDRHDSDQAVSPEQWARLIGRHNNRPPCGTLPGGGVRIRTSEPDAEASDV